MFLSREQIGKKKREGNRRYSKANRISVLSHSLKFRFSFFFPSLPPSPISSHLRIFKPGFNVQSQWFSNGPAYSNRYFFLFFLLSLSSSPFFLIPSSSSSALVLLILLFFTVNFLFFSPETLTLENRQFCSVCFASANSSFGISDCATGSKVTPELVVQSIISLCHFWSFFSLSVSQVECILLCWTAFFYLFFLLSFLFFFRKQSWTRLDSRFLSLALEGGE